MTDAKPLKSVVLFVHGFGSSAKCWEPLSTLLRQDERITARYDLEYFEYPTPWFSFNPLRRIPRLREIARALREFIDSPRFYGREVTLVGHSQGGLVIQGYLAELLEAGHGERLEAVRQVLLVATPNLGSTLLSPVRKVLSVFAPNPQERTLRVLDPEITDVRAVIAERVQGAKLGGPNAWPVPITCFYGLQDGIVLEASARGPFSHVVPLEGDHFTILRPRDARDARYSELVELLLEPMGHEAVFLVDRYENAVAVKPLSPVQAFEVAHGGKPPRTVRTDNTADVLRTVMFSPKNCCALPFVLRYATRNEGYVRPTMSHENEASPEEKGRYDDNGVEAVFKFTPRPGETYRLRVEVYKGFDPGHRDLHFHLGRQTRYQTLRVSLDLTAYVAAGYAVSQQPCLYLHAHDPFDHDLCRQRGLGTPVGPAAGAPSGVWDWELHNLRQGVVDLVWDVAAPGER
jgi:pimeloyl-ACP methyl ester carboxylesterase